METTNKSNLLVTFGKNIKRIRLLRGLSQENVASDIEKSVNFVSLVENGKTGLSIQTLVCFCKALNVDMNLLFSDIVAPAEGTTDIFIANSLNLLDEKDKSIIIELITYIINSKNQ